jgi:hypothetical protein
MFTVYRSLQEADLTALAHVSLVSALHTQQHPCGTASCRCGWEEVKRS